MLSNKAIIFLYCPLLLLLIDYLLASGYQRTKTIPYLKQVWSMKQTPNDRYNVLCLVWKVFCNVDDKNKKEFLKDLNSSINVKPVIEGDNFTTPYLVYNNSSTFKINFYTKVQKKKKLEKGVIFWKRKFLQELNTQNKRKMPDSLFRTHFSDVSSRNVYKKRFLLEYENSYADGETPLQSNPFNLKDNSFPNLEGAKTILTAPKHKNENNKNIFNDKPKKNSSLGIITVQASTPNTLSKYFKSISSFNDTYHHGLTNLTFDLSLEAKSKDSLNHDKSLNAENAVGSFVGTINNHTHFDPVPTSGSSNFSYIPSSSTVGISDLKQNISTHVHEKNTSFLLSTEESKSLKELSTFQPGENYDETTLNNYTDMTPRSEKELDNPINKTKNSINIYKSKDVGTKTELNREIIEKNLKKESETHVVVSPLENHNHLNVSTTLNGFNISIKNEKQDTHSFNTTLFNTQDVIEKKTDTTISENDYSEKPTKNSIYITSNLSTTIDGVNVTLDVKNRDETPVKRNTDASVILTSILQTRIPQALTSSSINNANNERSTVAYFLPDTTVEPESDTYYEQSKIHAFEDGTNENRSYNKTEQSDEDVLSSDDESSNFTEIVSIELLNISGTITSTPGKSFIISNGQQPESSTADSDDTIVTENNFENQNSVLSKTGFTLESVTRIKSEDTLPLNENENPFHFMETTSSENSIKLSSETPKAMTNGFIPTSHTLGIYSISTTNTVITEILSPNSTFSENSLNKTDSENKMNVSSNVNIKSTVSQVNEVLANDTNSDIIELTNSYETRHHTFSPDTSASSYSTSANEDIPLQSTVEYATAIRNTFLLTESTKIETENSRNYPTTTHSEIIPSFSSTNSLKENKLNVNVGNLTFSSLNFTHNITKTLDADMEFYKNQPTLTSSIFPFIQRSTPSEDMDSLHGKASLEDDNLFIQEVSTKMNFQSFENISTTLTKYITPTKTFKSHVDSSNPPENRQLSTPLENYPNLTDIISVSTTFSIKNLSAENNTSIHKDSSITEESFNIVELSTFQINIFIPTTTNLASSIALGKTEKTNIQNEVEIETTTYMQTFAPSEKNILKQKEQNTKTTIHNFMKTDTEVSSELYTPLDSYRTSDSTTSSATLDPTINSISIPPTNTPSSLYPMPTSFEESNTENISSESNEGDQTVISAERDTYKFTENTPKENENSGFDESDVEVIRTERDLTAIGGGINAGSSFGIENGMKESREESVLPNIGIGSGRKGKEIQIPTIEPPRVTPDSSPSVEVNLDSPIGIPGSIDLKVDLGNSGGETSGNNNDASVNANVDIGGVSGKVDLDLSRKRDKTTSEVDALNEDVSGDSDVNIAFKTESSKEDVTSESFESTLGAIPPFTTRIPVIPEEFKIILTTDKGSTSAIGTSSYSIEKGLYDLTTITKSFLGKDVTVKVKDVLTTPYIPFVSSTSVNMDVNGKSAASSSSTGASSSTVLNSITTEYPNDSEFDEKNSETDTSKFTENTPKDNGNSGYDESDVEVIRTERDLTAIGGGINAGSSFGIENGMKESVIPNIGIGSGSQDKEIQIPTIEPPRVTPDSPSVEINLDSPIGIPGSIDLKVDLGNSGGETSGNNNGASVNANVDIGGVSGKVDLDLSRKRDETIPDVDALNEDVSSDSDVNIAESSKEDVTSESFESTLGVIPPFTTRIPVIPEEKIILTTEKGSTSAIDTSSYSIQRKGLYDLTTTTESFLGEDVTVKVIDTLTAPNRPLVSSTSRNMDVDRKSTTSSSSTGVSSSTVLNPITTKHPDDSKFNEKIGELDKNLSTTGSKKPVFLFDTSTSTNSQTTVTTESSVITFHFTIDADYDEVVGTKKDMFQENLSKQLGIAMRLPFECIQNLQVKKGSIEVEFELHPSSDHGHMADEKAIKAAADELKRMIDTGQLTINDLDGNTLVVVPLDPPTKPPPANEMEHTTLILGVIIGAFIITVITVAITAIIVKRKSNSDQRLSPIEEARSKLPSYREIPFEEALFIKGNERNKLMYGKYCYNTGQWMGPGPEPKFFQAPESIIYRPPTDLEIRRTPRPPTAVRERLKHQWEVDWDGMVSSR